MATDPLYIFIDESGDFNFTASGTRHYTFTAVITPTPYDSVEAITRLRHEILSGDILSCINLGYLENHLCHLFHATEDKQPVRDLFFELIGHMGCFQANSIVIRKYRTNPTLREPHVFYPRFLGSLLDYVFKAYRYSKLCIFVDGTPVNKQKKLFINTIKSEIVKKGPKTPFRIYFPTSASNCFLQITDYVNWAIFRKWEDGDTRSYDLIRGLLERPELDAFRSGDMDYY